MRYIFIRGKFNRKMSLLLNDDIKSQIVGNNLVGDTGFEPVTSTVCKRHKKKGKGKR